MILYKSKITQISNPSVDTFFLWKHDSENIYLMDNHRCALWCWEDSARQNTFSNHFLIHIDQHDDLNIPATNAPTNVSSFTISSYLNSKVSGVHDYRWDNYILQYKVIHPNLKYKMYTGAKFRNYSGLSADLHSLPPLNLASDFLAINLDLDLFFTANTKKIKTNGYNNMFAICYDCLKLYQKYRNNAVFTIALSPTCCGKSRDLNDVIKTIKVVENVLSCDINKDVNFWDYLW